MAKAQTIQIFLPKGDPTGLRVGEITTRTIRLIDMPRSELSAFLELEESSRVGVYFLIGDSTSSEHETDCYIGQSGNVGTRLSQHNNKKEFWSRALIAVSSHNQLTDTHARYLEWLSISMGQTFNRYRIINGNNGTKPHTPVHLKADCDEIIETIAVLLSTLGVHVLEGPKPVLAMPSKLDSVINKTAKEIPVEESDEETLFYCAERGSYSIGKPWKGRFLVQKGSLCTPLGPTQSCPKPILKRIEQLKKEGILAPHIDEKSGLQSLKFVSDYIFGSPSGAGSVVTQSSINGNLCWQDINGTKLNAFRKPNQKKEVIN